MVPLLPALVLALTGCPSPGPTPRPKPKPVESSEPAPVQSAEPLAPAPAPTPAPPRTLESPGLKIRLVSPKLNAVRRFAPIDVIVDVLHEESIEAVRVNGSEGEWRFSRDYTPKPKQGAKPAAEPLQLSRSRYQVRLKYPVSGENPLTLEVEDQAGRIARSHSSFTFRPPDSSPPTITLLSPHDGAVRDKAPVLVKIKVSDPGGVARVTINGAEVKRTAEGIYQASMPRPSGGINRLRLDAWDRVGNQATLRAQFTFRPSDTAPPRIQVIDPDEGVVVRDAPVTIRVRVVDDDGGVAAVRINGKPAKATKDGFFVFKLERPLVGLNPIRVVAWDPAGNRATYKTQFRFE